MFDKILIVCVGNICRSPSAEFLLKERLPQKKIQSAGLATEKSQLSGADLDAQARDIAAKHGHEWPLHTAKQINRELVKWADLVLVMENNQREQLAMRYPEAQGKTMLMGNWIGEAGKPKEIPDPYQKSDEAFEYVFTLLNDAVNSWVTKLK